MITSQNIIDKHFNKAKMFGYRPDEVDDFLDSIVKTIRELETENEELHQKIQMLNEKIAGYQEDEQSLRTALVGAQKLGDSMVREARQKADAILQEANYQAEQIVMSAKRREENQREGLEKIKAEVSDFKSRLINIYRQHIELIRELPASEPETTENVSNTDTAEETSASVESSEVSTVDPTLTDVPQSAAETEDTTESVAAETEHTPGIGLQISFDRFKNEYPEVENEQQHEHEVLASRIASRYDKAGDTYSGLNKDSKFGQLKFGVGYELSRDNERKKKR